MFASRKSEMAWRRHARRSLGLGQSACRVLLNAVPVPVRNMTVFYSFPPPPPVTNPDGNRNDCAMLAYNAEGFVSIFWVCLGLYVLFCFLFVVWKSTRENIEKIIGLYNSVARTLYVLVGVNWMGTTAPPEKLLKDNTPSHLIFGINLILF